MPENGATSNAPKRADVDALEPQIDALYALPLAEFTAARNALAKTLKGDTAARVKRLEKSAAVAWAANQLFWRARLSYDRLMAAGRSLREAQVAALSGAAADLTRASTEHRAALSAAVTTATRLADECAVRPGADPLSRMLETMSLAPEPPAHPGRHVDVLQPAGFEALAGISPTALAPAVASPRPHAETRPAALPENSGPKADPASERQKAEVIAAARKAADTDLQQARRRLEQAHAAEVRLRSQVDAARVHLGIAFLQRGIATFDVFRTGRGQDHELLAGGALRQQAQHIDAGGIDPVHVFEE